MYREWWFFALYDPSSDIAFCMGYAVDDPLGTFGGQKVGIAGMIWPSVKNYEQNGNIVLDVQDSFNYSDFHARPQDASVQITSSNRIEVIDAQHYQVIGSSKDQSIKWWLSYQQTSYACRQVVEFPELQLDWISYMPAARVKGVIQVHGKNTSIDTVGYHDHNYGSWPASMFDWIWAQFNEPTTDFAIVMGAYKIPLTSSYVGYVFIRHEGKRIKIGSLCGNSFELHCLGWKKFNGRDYCVHTRVQAQSHQWKVQMEYKAQVSDRNPGDRGLGLLVYEQVSSYHVEFYQNTGSESQPNWNLVVQPTGFGFSEWCDLKV